MNNLFIIISLFFSLETLAKSELVNLENFKSEDSKYRYYIGIADSRKNESEALQLARENAFQSAIGELFGIMVEMRISTTESISDVNFIKRNSLSFDQVKLVNFEMIDFKISNENSINAKLLFKYPKSEIEIEKKRHLDLLSNKIGKSLNVYNKVGINENYPEITINALHKGNEVIDADIYLNNEKVAFTPLKIRKKLKIGLNKILVKHANFNDYIHEFEVKSNDDLKFKFNLKKAHSLVEFKSNIDGSKVYINNNYVGDSPVYMNLEIMRFFNIKFTKEGFEDLIVSNFTVDDKFNKFLSVDMIKKYDPLEYGPGCEDDEDYGLIEGN